MENQEKTQNDFVKEAMEEAAKAAAEAEAKKADAANEEADATEATADEATEAENTEATEEAVEDVMDEAVEEAAEETSEEGKKKGFFGRKKEKKDKKDEQIAELNDRVLRQMAEFDNYRKRTEKEKSHMYEVGAKDVIEKMLPIVDNFERGLAQVSEDQKDDPFVQGMEMIYKQMMTTLEQIGVKPIEAVGQPFDPNFHNAVMHIDNEELGENIVAAEFQKGYMYRDQVIRFSMVQVAN